MWANQVWQKNSGPERFTCGTIPVPYHTAGLKRQLNKRRTDAIGEQNIIMAYLSIGSTIIN